MACVSVVVHHKLIKIIRAEPGAARLLSAWEAEAAGSEFKA